MKQFYKFEFSNEILEKLPPPPFEITGKTIANGNTGEFITVISLQELMPFLAKIHELVDKVNELEEQIKKGVEK